jgi:hypothetical protein
LFGLKFTEASPKYDKLSNEGWSDEKIKKSGYTEPFKNYCWPYVGPYIGHLIV